MTWHEERSPPFVHDSDDAHHGTVKPATVTIIPSRPEANNPRRGGEGEVIENGMIDLRRVSAIHFRLLVCSLSPTPPLTDDHRYEFSAIERMCGERAMCTDHSGVLPFVLRPGKIGV
jgi:hypothetical protein